MQITDKDIQTFRERAKTELKSNGAVGRLAWDAVVDALCNEVEELRKNAAISNAVDSAWVGVCAACAEGTPPARCAYYGDPNGCNAPTLGKHPEGNLAERLQEELEKSERRITELERALGNASALRKALIHAKRDHWFNMTPELRDEIYDVLTSELPSNTVSMRAALQSVNRTMEIEARINCTEKGELGKFGNTQSELCKRCRARNCECWQMTIKREVESALSAPPRNCDVGDAAEQSERLAKFCKANYKKAKKDKHICSECQFNDCIGECPLKWAQLPFTPGKGGAE